jgi:aminopeptidase N
MDIAMAKFLLSEDKKNRLVVYCLGGDEPGAEIVLKAMERSLDFFSESFGSLSHYEGFTVIEVPDGWGSQASDYYILQTAAAFKDPAKLSEVYHEIAHMWNVRARAPQDRSRWFDEAFASYFEGLAIRAFEGDDAFQAYMDRRRDRFIKSATEDRKNYETPIAEYWKGAWSLYILHQLIGDEAFKRTIKTLRSEFSDRAAGFEDFVKIAESVSGKNLKNYFDDWIFGAESSRFLVEKVSVKDILKRYE